MAKLKGELLWVQHLDNVDHWLVFEDDKQISRFMEMSREFESLKVNQENMFEEGENVEPNPKYLTQLKRKDIIQLNNIPFQGGWFPWKKFLTVMIWQGVPRWLQVMLKWNSAI